MTSFSLARRFALLRRLRLWHRDFEVESRKISVLLDETLLPGLLSVLFFVTHGMLLI